MWPSINKVVCKNKLLRRINPFSISKIENSSDGTNLKDALAKEIPEARKRLKAVKECFGDVVIDKVKLKQVFTGMRDIKGLVYDISYVDPIDSVQLRNMSLDECEKKLVKAKCSDELLPESILWLLMTGNPPTEEQSHCLVEDLKMRATLPDFIVTLLDAMPKTIHPMAQFSAAITSMSSTGKFAKKYSEGIKKEDYWFYAYEDAMDLIARLPYLAAHIYLNLYKNKKGKENICMSPDMDWAQNFARMLGFNDPKFAELMRLFLSIHCDNEGGNVSAHTILLVSSGLSDPYLSFAAGMNGLAGPLHGLANQDVLKWIHKLIEKHGCEPSCEVVEKYCRETLKSGSVIPGYGHAVLRATDKRFVMFNKFCHKHLPDDPIFKIVNKLHQIVPHILNETGKVQNPWPNVDAHSGMVLEHFGMTQMEFYTVCFGISRALGTMAGLIWARALGYPIERPRSYMTDQYIEMALRKQKSKEAEQL